MVSCVHQVSDVQSVCSEAGSTLLDEKSNHIKHKKKVCSICGHNDGCWWCINNPHWCLISLLSLELRSPLTGAEPSLLLYISDVFELSLAQQTDRRSWCVTVMMNSSHHLHPGHNHKVKPRMNHVYTVVLHQDLCYKFFSTFLDAR